MVLSGFEMKILANNAVMFLFTVEDAAEGAAALPPKDVGKLGVWIAFWKVIIATDGLPDEDFPEVNIDLILETAKFGKSRNSRGSRCVCDNLTFELQGQIFL